MRVLVLGGAGFIGSHTCVALAETGHEAVVLDNFSAASERVLERLARITGATLPLVRADVRDTPAVIRALDEHRIEAVIHFAALKSVADSVAHPLPYFDNNITGTLSLLRAMQACGITRLVFSSSAAVYGTASTMPVREDSPLGIANPYGRTKLVMEHLIGDVCASDPAFSALLLRYFNPIGAHESALIGEDPRGEPGNLMPYVAQVAVGRRERLRVFGGDWPTRDGTGVRDYIHVMDLAQAHVAAVEALAAGHRGATPVNLGTGQGTTVLELVRAFEAASGRPVPFDIVGRRPGDVAELWADPGLARRLLGWEARLGLDRMCEDSWRWQQANPEGYGH